MKRLYIKHRCRLAAPFETLLLQGIHFGDRSNEVLQMCGTKIQDLAGSAFQTWCCASAMLVSLLLRARAYRNIRTVLADSIVSRVLCPEPASVASVDSDSAASSDAGSLTDLLEHRQHRRRDCLDELLRPAS